MVRHKGIVKFAYVRQFLAGCETYFIAPTAWYYVRSLGQNELFLALMLSSFNISAVIGGPLFGRIVDWIGHPRLVFLFACWLKVISYILYSINISAFFPLVGRLVSGLGSGGSVAVILGQVAIQTDVEERGTIFVLIEAAYCVGATVGPGVGSFIAFDVTIWGWHINQGNSPGIILAIVWSVFFIVTILLPKDIWIEKGTVEKQIVSEDEGRTTDDRTFTENDPKGDRRLTEIHPKGDRILAEYDLNVDRHLTKDVAIADPEDDRIKPSGHRTVVDLDDESKTKIEWNSRIFCLLYLTFASEFFSSTATFYVPVLALNHFHLELIYVKLLFLNCTLFTVLVFILFSLASDYFDERKLFLVALLMQIAAISVLTWIGFSWDHITSAQNYMLLLYICLGMPYFAFPFGNSILSKITDARNASFYQGVSYASMQSGILISRVVVSFVNTKESLIIYCFVLMFLWLLGLIWFAVHYKQFVASEEKHQ
ncbi:major facilitator superfamily domain-containing 8 [Paramuricea clavata]|uniref:Major facilitator superfamily domain-containing 8 n=1 Tax=Paramuricea clavata TaxID=317549 RepID=A0A6S7HFB6_PARCT|nr:major facilitator superfamily domain-containing 8 [Paramuricea clavata]